LSLSTQILLLALRHFLFVNNNLHNFSYLGVARMLEFYR